jgi:RNA polymerase sigma-70 factor (ECF subfamily)
MPSHDPANPAPGAVADQFATTHWSLVLAAAQRDSPESARALAALCEAYWYPLYAFARRRGHSPEDAQDLTQGFFAVLLEKEYLRVADSARGKFRPFLLTAFQHYISKEHARARAQKRGGTCRHLSLDFEAGESRYTHEPAHLATPETIYQRRWAILLLDRVLSSLREDYARMGKEMLFDRLRIFLTGEQTNRPYAEVAAELEMTEGALKVAIHRLRRRYREILRAEIAQTVERPDDVDDELRQLFDAVRAR